jgi:hypothetical protein
MLFSKKRHGFWPHSSNINFKIKKRKHKSVNRGETKEMGIPGSEHLSISTLVKTVFSRVHVFTQRNA